MISKENLSGGTSSFNPSEVFNPLENVDFWELPETEYSYLLSQIDL